MHIFCGAISVSMTAKIAWTETKYIETEFTKSK